MCGRFTLFADEELIMNRFGLTHKIKSYKPSYNVAPGQDVLIVINDGKNKRAGYVRWGLVPSWEKDEKIGYKMINARLETAHEKPSFKNLMARKRCLIIADSFYEWDKTDEKKEPHRIQVKDRRLFAFAGLWDKWEGKEQALFTCTMLTKDSNTFMKNIHHRMPIILAENKEDEWIQPHIWQPTESYHFLRNIEMDPFGSYKVSNYVNKATNNDENCIKSII